VRTAFIRALTEAAARNDRVTLLVGDLGFSVVEGFAAQFPGQYLNVGVAEQNMAGVAAGLALAGRIVFTYSIGNFPTLRCLEQVRNDICYHRLNVKVVTVGGGFAYGALGVSHHATEDLAIMRALPNMTVVAPGDPAEAEWATRALVDHAGACYLRLGKAGEPLVHSQPTAFQLGRAIVAREGGDCTLIATGGMLYTTLQAANALARTHRIEARVLSMHTLKPVDVDAVRAAASQTQAIITVEEHSVIGGLGSAVADVLVELNDRPRFKSIGLASQFATTVGDQQYLRERAGLSVPALVKTVACVLEPITTPTRQPTPTE
jgi:transketolase